jgi:NitT/TauT family transport system substrate-binding protein
MAARHRKGKRRVIFRLLLGSCLLAAMACGTAPASGGAGALTVSMAYMPNLTHAAGLIAVGDGSLRTALAPHALDVKSFSAGPQLIEALMAGEVDIALVGPNPALNGFIKSRGQALRVIAGASSGGALFVVRPGVTITTPADLAGKKIATPQRGGTQDIALRFLARGAGLKTADEGGTVSVVPMQPADILTSFQRGQIDGAWMAEPWCTRLIQEANATVWFDERSKWPDQRFATAHVIVSTRFLKDHPDLVRAFLRTHVEATQFTVAHPTEAQTIANREIGRITTAALPARVLESAFRNVDYTWDPLASSVAVMADHAHQLGFLGPSEPDLRTLYDLAPLNEVLREKGLPDVTAGGHP